MLIGLLIAAAFAGAYFVCSDKYPKLAEIFRLTFFAVLLATLLTTRFLGAL